jgi:hypothetical protein
MVAYGGFPVQDPKVPLHQTLVFPLFLVTRLPDIYQLYSLRSTACGPNSGQLPVPVRTLPSTIFSGSLFQYFAILMLKEFFLMLVFALSHATVLLLVLVLNLCSVSFFSFIIVLIASGS